MRFRFSWTAAAIVLAVALLPLKTGGCGRTACIQAQKGMCPSPNEVMSFFNNNCGSSSIRSIDGEPAFDGQLCCYPVTQGSLDFDSFGCVEPGDVGGGFSTGGGVGGVGGVGGCDEFGACGGTGGGVPCITCLDQLNSGPFPTDLLCPGDLTAWLELSDCGCKVACPDECSFNLCSSATPGAACSSCLESGCSAQLFDCLGN